MLNISKSRDSMIELVEFSLKVTKRCSVTESKYKMSHLRCREEGICLIFLVDADG